jgi:hypothetical protein
METSDKVTLNANEKRLFAKFGLMLLLAIAIFVYGKWSRFTLDHRVYPKSDLAAALAYLDSLPRTSAPTLFATSSRDFRLHGNRELAWRALGEFRSTQAVDYLSPPGFGWKIHIMVLPGFLKESTVRQRQLAAEMAGNGLADSIVRLAGNSNGCIAGKDANFGWTDRGFVLVDPNSGQMADTQVVACIVAGLDFVNGLPVRADTFSIKEIPPAAVSAAILDYVMRCAYDGETESEPPNRSRGGITTQPSIKCVHDRISTTLASKQN